jgi:hypothetical protein
MPGMVADVNIEGHFQVLLLLLRQDSRRAFWVSLNFTTPTFDELGLLAISSDRAVWQKCQEAQLVLITANRNDDGPDSLEATIRDLNRMDSLPVITLADPDRIFSDRHYAERTADQLLEYLMDLEKYRGTGRLYVP